MAKRRLWTVLRWRFLYHTQCTYILHKLLYYIIYLPSYFINFNKIASRQWCLILNVPRDLTSQNKRWRWLHPKRTNYLRLFSVRWPDLHTLFRNELNNSYLANKHNQDIAQTRNITTSYMTSFSAVSTGMASSHERFAEPI